MTSISLMSQMKQHSKTLWMLWEKGYLAWKVSDAPPRQIPAGQAAVGCFRCAIGSPFAEFEWVALGVSLISVWYSQTARVNPPHIL